MVRINSSSVDLDNPATPEVAISVISHGHGAQLIKLMHSLEDLCRSHIKHVVVTVNVPEPDLLAELESFKWVFGLTIIKNLEPRGFGANHNAAFKLCNGDFFCVLNPDIDFEADPFPEIISYLTQPSIGCAFPVQLDEKGEIQDYARALPSPSAVFARYMGHRFKKPMPLHPDWFNGAFMLFRTDVYRQLDGFDERYFMYCEDVDICLRAQLSGYRLAMSKAKVTHAAHRNSRVNFRHLVWHAASLLRLWSSASYRNFSRMGKLN
jgi:N-acetylglucosaminyl-diphospho-decaprenol L-rhamnosyltransferase